MLPRTGSTLMDDGLAHRLPTRRVGFHDVSETCCSPTGVIVLDTFGDEAPIDEMVEKLNAIEGIEARKIVFEE